MLRAYQQDLIDKTRAAYKDGYSRPCIVLGCGGGKSIIAAEIAKRATDKGNRVLFLVHRRELCDQVERTFRAWGVNMRLCHIGMVQTVTRRIGKIAPPSLIITDENHHCMASSYRKIYEAFPDARCVGFTATPVRLNGGGLGDINDQLIEGVSAQWLIRNEYLAPYDYYAPPVADLSGLKTSRGEFVASDIEGRLLRKAVFGDVLSYYNDLAFGKQAICYCASVEHSKRMAQAFCEAGIAAAHIDGESEKAARNRIITSFRNGDTRILCNVDLISEGFDVPDCTAAILLRPTQSLTLYIQQSMRCMRYKPGKRAVIIDHVGNYARHGMPDAERTWSLEPKRKAKREGEPEAKVRQCAKCFFVHEYTQVCPMCGYVYPVKERTIEEIKEAALTRIEGFVLNFTAPEDCASYDELRAFAKNHGYKPGWAYYKAKERGLLHA